MALTEAQIKARAGKVTASFAPYLMAGKEDRIREEWMRLVGHPLHKEPDWSERWNLRYGEIVEPLALDWHEVKTGQPLTRRGEVVTHSDLPHVCCTLDAWRAQDDCVIDCKAWSSWQKIDYICGFLCPQMIVQRACTEAKAAALLIVHGGSEPVEYPLTWSPEYEALVWQRIGEFWQSVLDLTPPVAMPSIEPPAPAVREVDMNGRNEWADNAFQWLECREASKKFVSADKALKALVPADAKRCFGHEIEIRRAKNGSLTIREIE